MLKQLAKMIANARDNEIQDLKEENKQLGELVEALRQEKEGIEWDRDTLKIQKTTLLDEIVANQTRIDALLRQLKEKQGGY